MGTSPPATGGGTGGDDDDEAEEEPPAEVEIEGADAIDVLFSDQAILKQLDPVKKKWSNKGTGRVSLRREKDTGVPYVVFTSGSGMGTYVTRHLCQMPPTPTRTLTHHRQGAVHVSVAPWATSECGW